MHAFRLVDEQEMDDGKWQVRFTAQDSGEIHSLTIGLEKSEAKVYESCILDKATFIKDYRLISHEALLR